MKMDPLAHDNLDDKERERLKKGAPQIPPLPVAPGGGAANSPYPDYEITRPDKWELDWDAKTREAVARRVREIPRYLFFDAQEASLLEVMCARALPQPDRPLAQRIPIAPYIDERLYRGGGDGYHYGDMPPDRLSYKYALVGVEQTAAALHGQNFAALVDDAQDNTLQQIAEGSPPGQAWEALSAERFFQIFMADVIAVYYGHPAAWAEIGFQGPASPRGHVRLSLGKRDPWEAEEKRPRSSTALVERALQRQRKQQGRSAQ